MSEFVLEDQTQPGVTVLTLNRPEKRNALSIPVLEALVEGLSRVADRDDQRVLVLRGAGPAFCAGLDLAEALDPERNGRSAALVREVLEGICQCSCVTIAGVHGAALAGGAGLMIACDIAIAGMETCFGFPEVHRGMVAGLVMPFLRRQLLDRHARELLLLGEIVDAERAAEIGLITRAVPTDMLDATIERHVAQVLKSPAGAIRDTKAFFNQLGHRPMAEEFSAAATMHVKMRTSAEAQEGMQAFIEKRKPSWEM